MYPLYRNIKDCHIRYFYMYMLYTYTRIYNVNKFHLNISYLNDTTVVSLTRLHRDYIGFATHENSFYRQLPQRCLRRKKRTELFYNSPAIKAPAVLSNALSSVSPGFQALYGNWLKSHQFNSPSSARRECTYSSGTPISSLQYSRTSHEATFN
jgi:hypothetical protein